MARKKQLPARLTLTSTKDEVLSLLRRLTTLRIKELVEVTGQYDFRDSIDSFYFTVREIAQFACCEKKVIHSLLAKDYAPQYLHNNVHVVSQENLETRLNQLAS